MSIYCKIVEGSIVARERKNNPISKIVNGEPVWRELIGAGDRPAFDSATHHKPVMAEVIESTRVVQSWVDAVVKTQAEIDEETQARKDAVIARTERGMTVENLQKKIAFKLNNRLRILEGKTELTPTAFNTWYEGQL